MKHLNRGHILRAWGPLLKTKHFKCSQKLFMIKKINTYKSEFRCENILSRMKPDKDPLW